MDIQLVGIVSGICLLMTILIATLPTNITSKIGEVFSLGKSGLHYSRMYRDDRDILGSGLMFVGLLYALFFGFVPYEIEKYVFGIIYWLMFLLVLGQYFRVYGDVTRLKRLPVISAICIMASVNFIAAGGFLNGFGFMSPCVEFVNNVVNGNVLQLTYFLANTHFVAYMISFFLYSYSFYCLVAQFKYLRLEDHYKANNPVFLWFKVILISAIMLGISYHGYYFMMIIFNKFK